MTKIEKNLLHRVIEIAQQMTEVGAEISRVEESVARIFEAYGAVRVDVYATTSNIIVSVENPEGEVLTQTRRIGRSTMDMERLHQYNDLVRWISFKAPELSEIEKRLQQIQYAAKYPVWLTALFGGVISASFCVFFGGRDAAEITIAFAVGVLINIVSAVLGKGKVSLLLIRFLCAFMASCIAVSSVKLGVTGKPDYILIGNIMILIPGVGLTNALRDLFSGDVMTGILRSIEAILLTLAIALGIILPMLMGGVL